MTKSILLSVDLNQESSWRKALPEAVKLANADKAQLHVLTVIPTYGMPMVGAYFPSDYAEKAEAEAAKQLADLIARKVPEGVKVETHVEQGTIYKRIIETADRLGCDLIVLASHRPEMQDYLIGPNAAKVVRHARQSVYVVRE